MARLPLVDPATASPAVREVLEALPAPLGIFRLMAHAESSFRPLLRLGTSILARQQLSPRLRELAILQAAKLTPGAYEWVQHVPIARAVGASDAQIAAVEKGEWDAECLAPAERVALRFGAETLEKARVSDALFEELRGHFSPREIVELVLTLGYYSMLARLTEVVELAPEAPAGTRIVAAATRERGGD
jgi:alkylhydroperoxidase family enzyme